MNDHDDIAQRFARDEQPAATDAFVGAVQRRIDRERHRARYLAIAGAVTLVVVVAVAALLLVPELTYAVQLVQQLLTSRLGIIACALCALALTVWPRLSED